MLFVQYMDQCSIKESKHIVFEMQKSRLKFVRTNIHGHWLMILRCMFCIQLIRSCQLICQKNNI